MRRLTLIILTLLLAFAAASMVIYRLGPGRNRPRNRIATATIVPEVKTAEGHVQNVDVGAGTLTLIDGDREAVFTFDERTTIVFAGQTVPPASIETGADATVKYAKRGEKNWARRIELVAANEKGD